MGLFHDCRADRLRPSATVLLGQPPAAMSATPSPANTGIRSCSGDPKERSAAGIVPEWNRRLPLPSTTGYTHSWICGLNDGQTDLLYAYVAGWLYRG